MKRYGLFIRVIRDVRSFDFKADLKKNSFENNWKNNSLDVLELMNDGEVLFSCRVQTVANHPENNGENDTIADGTFQIRCFVEPRLFRPRIHAIINTTDMDGERIDHEAMQYKSNGFQNGRWLIHSRYSARTDRDTNYAWSLGCFIPSTVDLDRLNAHLDVLGVSRGDIINGEIRTV